MPSACGVTWDGTSMGDLDESEIPNDDFEAHYINAGETKSESSFPVVDGDGNLRAGNVNSAWDLRNQGEGVSEDCLREMDAAFDENILPDTAYENSEFAVDTPDFESGDIVEWRALDATGRIVHMPEDQHILMVDLLEQTDDGWESTGYTLTAGYPDVQKKAQMERQRAQYSSTVVLGDQTNDDADVYGVNVEFGQLPTDAISDGFNKHGVRENDDGSIDVRFTVMEPGVRKGVQVTPEFLRQVASHEYGQIPLQLDHSDSQRANVGFVDPENIKYADGVLRAQAHIPNTGSDIRDDVIADFTHNPPQITDISAGFDPQSMEVERPQSRNGDPTFIDGQLREFSLTPFPAGYEDGGLTPKFSEAVEEIGFSDADGSTESGSQLIKRTHTLIQSNND